MTQEEFNELSAIDKVEVAVKESLKEHEGVISDFWKGSKYMGESVLEAIKIIKQHESNKSTSM